MSTASNMNAAPQTIEHFVGAKQIKERVKVALEATWNQGNGCVFPHTLALGPPGIGKTEMSKLIARESGCELVEVLGQSIYSMGELNAALMQAEGVFTDRLKAVGKALRSCSDSVLFQRPTNHVDGHSRFFMSSDITIIEPTDDLPNLGADNDARLIELWLHGRPATTQRAYRAESGRFLAHVAKPLHQVVLGDLHGYADALESARLQPATRRRMLAALKSLFSFGHRLGFFPFDTAKPLRLPPLRDTLAERIIEESSLLRMIDLELNARNAAIVALMYGAALRVSELVGLRWRDVQPRADRIGQITALGKGSKTRTILLSTGVFARVMALRCDAHDGAAVFASRKGRGHLNTSHVLRITKAAAKRAGITRNVRNHDLRHSHATHSLERGAPISLVSQTLGHASISTTGKYLHARPGDSSGRYLAI